MQHPTILAGGLHVAFLTGIDEVAGTAFHLFRLGEVDGDNPVVEDTAHVNLGLGNHGLAQHVLHVAGIGADVEDVGIVIGVHVVAAALFIAPDIPLPEHTAVAPAAGGAGGVHPHAGLVGSHGLHPGTVGIDGIEILLGEVRLDVDTQEVVDGIAVQREPAGAESTAREVVVTVHVLAAVHVHHHADGGFVGLPGVGVVGLGDVSVHIVPDQFALTLIGDDGLRFRFHGNAVVLIPCLPVACGERECGKRE